MSPRFRTQVVKRYECRSLPRAMAAAASMMSAEWMDRRAREIIALPVVEWRGKRLCTIRCNGTTGKGPHDVHVPESLLWALLSLTHYRCVYH